VRNAFATAAFAIGLAAIGAATGTAFAAGSTQPAATQGQWMTVDQITTKLKAEGYQVRQVKAQGKVYEFKGFDPKGRRIETEIDPVSGTVLGTDSDD
jgi:hypothetical protein